MSLILRETKGSKLSISELDGNFTYLESLINSGTSSSADLSGTNYRTVYGTGTDVENALELATTYQSIAGLSPSIASQTNQITILVAPGYYNFESDFTMNTPYINIVSLSGLPDVIFNGTGSVVISANCTLSGVNVGTKPLAKFIPTGLDGLVINNCVGGDYSITLYDYGDDLSGHFANCYVGDNSFTGTFSGSYTGDLSGTFINCKAGNNSFEGRLTGKFINCHVNGNGFGYSTSTGLTTTGIISYSSATGYMGPIGFAWSGTQSPGYSINTDGGEVIYCHDSTGITINFTNPPCLAKGTKILLANKTYKNIEDVTYDDSLMVWNFDLGKFDVAMPLWIKEPGISIGYNLLKFSDGTELKTLLPTIGHRIFNINDGRFSYPMTETEIGQKTFNENGLEITLVSKEVINEEIEFYNIITDKHMNLFANTILTSCRFNNIYPINDMKFIKDNRKLRTREEFKNIPDKYYYGLRLREQTFSLSEIEQYIHRMETSDVLQTV